MSARSSIRQAWLIGLPISRETSNASSSRCCSTRAAKRCRISPRSRAGSRGHGPSSNARRAAATATSTSFSSAQPSSTTVAPSRGESTARTDPLIAGRCSPSTNIPHGACSALARCTQSMLVTGSGCPIGAFTRTPSSRSRPSCDAGSVVVTVGQWVLDRSGLRMPRNSQSPPLAVESTSSLSVGCAPTSERMGVGPSTM